MFMNFFFQFKMHLFKLLMISINLFTVKMNSVKNMNMVKYG